MDGQPEAHLLHFEITETVQSARLTFTAASVAGEDAEHSWMQMIPRLPCTGISILAAGDIDAGGTGLPAGDGQSPLTSMPQ